MTARRTDRAPGKERRILCTSCNAPLEVAQEAKSVVCPACNQRVVTEAVVVAGYVAVRRYPVANRITIAKKGIVYASIRADDLDIDGVLRGEALVLGRCHLKKHARVTGNLRASQLVVDKGASLVGHVHVGPDSVDELDVLAGAAGLTGAAGLAGAAGGLAGAAGVGPVPAGCDAAYEAAYGRDDAGQGDAAGRLGPEGPPD